MMNNNMMQVPMMNRMMAEDVGAAPLRNPLNHLKTNNTRCRRRRKPNDLWERIMMNARRL